MQKRFDYQRPFLLGISNSQKKVILSTLQMTAIEGPIEFKNISLYLREKVDEMILGLLFIDEVSFKFSSHSAKNHERLNGLEFTLKKNPPTPQVCAGSSLRIRAMWDSDCALIQMDHGAPLDNTDPLEEDTPCLSTGKVNTKEATALVSSMRDRPMMQ